MDNLVTLQDLFKNNVFKIPDYQRGYSWENKHRRDLLEDLDSIQLTREGGQEKERRHYTGTVVLEPHGTQQGFGESYTRFDIVDGQQRLTTLSILLNAVVNELRDVREIAATKISQIIKERYIMVEGPQGNIFKLSLDEDNDIYFKQAIIMDKDDVERTIRSHQNLADAKEQFERYFSALKKRLSPTDYFAELKDLTQKITQLLVFTVYAVEDNSEVGVIFEVMNDRGKPLSELEKVKNFLMYMTNRVSGEPSSTELIERINFSWKEILQNMAKAGRFDSSDENQFLRVNAITQFYTDLAQYIDQDGKTISVSSQLADIHELLKQRFKRMEKEKTTYRVESYKAIGEYVDDLRGSSMRFRDLLRPYEGFSFQHMQEGVAKNEMRLVAAQFGRMDTEATLLPLNVAIYERFHDSPETQLPLMKTMEAFAFRIYGIGNHRPYTAQTTIYRLAGEIHRGKRTADEIDSEIRGLGKEYVSDDDLTGYLTDPKVDYYDWNALRYFLYEYERSQCSKRDKKPYFEWEELEKKDREDTIEHILPQDRKSVV